MYGLSISQESEIITQSVLSLLQLNPSLEGPPQHKAPENLGDKSEPN